LLLAEIAEMKGLHGRDSEWIKAWITKRHENWTPKFKEFNTRFARRTILIGTSNKPGLLSDETGHRRWLPTTVGDFTDVEGIERDRAQLWAEGADLFMVEGVAYQEAEELAKAEHAHYEIHDEWEPIVAAWLDADDDFSNDKPRDRDGLTTHEVMQGALNKDAKNCTRGDEMRIGTCLRSLGYETRQLRRDGVRVRLYFKA
jgi:predicted P-loop ATPase